MGKNDFDIDFDFDEEYNFDPKAFLGTVEGTSGWLCGRDRAEEISYPEDLGQFLSV